MKTCSKCNTSYEDDKKFCKKCGIPLITEYNIDPKELAKKSVYEDRLKADPLNIDILKEYAQFLFNNLLFKESNAVLLKILAINENNYFAKELLLKSYNKLNMAKEAIEIGEQLLKEKPDDIILFEELAETAKKLGNLSKATDYYDKIIKLQPSNSNALNNKALSLLNNNQLEAAIEIFKKLYLDGGKDKITTIYAALDNALNNDYKSAIDILKPVLSSEEISFSDLNNNRGFLYLTYCLCQTNADISEIKKYFVLINIHILKGNYHIIDEDILSKTVSYLINNGLNNVEKSNTDNYLLNLTKIYLGVTEFYFTKNTNITISEIWFNIGSKEAEFKFYSDAVKSLKKAVDLLPGEYKYTEKYAEIKKLFDSQNKRSKRRKIIISVSILLFVLLFVFLYGSIKENSDWNTAKKINTIASLQNYINDYYPKGKHINEATKLKEEAIWNDAKATNTVQSYDNYLSLYPNGKYVNECKKMGDEAVINEQKNKNQLKGKHTNESNNAIEKNSKSNKENIVINGDFSNNFVNWEVVNFTNGANSRIVVEDGKKVAKLHHDSGCDWAAIAQEIRSKLKNGVKYQFKCRYKLNGQFSSCKGCDFNLRFSFHDNSLVMHSHCINNSCFSKTCKINGVTDNKWHIATINFTASNTMPQPDEPMLTVCFDYGGMGDIYVGDISITEL